MIFSKLKRLFFGRNELPRVAQATPSTLSPVATDGLSAEAMYALFIETILGAEPMHTQLSLPEKLVGQAIEQQLRDPVQRAAAVPRLPTVIPMLMKQLRDPNSSARDHVALITQDPVIATAVLRVANSVYFNPYRKKRWIISSGQ